MRKTRNAQLGEGQGRRGAYQAFGEAYNFVRSNQGKFAPPKKYVLAKPEKKDINARLGPPDFFPLDAHAPEDSLKQKSIIDGLIEPRIVSDEFGSLRRYFGVNGLNATEVKTQLLQYVHEIEWKRSTTPKEKDRSKRTASSAFFPEQVVTSAQFRESWIPRLAGPEGLHRLAVQVPHGFKGDPLLKALMDCNVPILRATWFIKIIYLNMKQNRQKNPIDPTTDWTITLDRFLTQQIKDFHSSKGVSTIENGERLARPIYVVKLIKWSYCEGLLDKEKFLSLMMEHLSEMTRIEDVYVILRVLIQYMEDVSFSTVHSRRLLTHINARLVRVGTRPTPLYTPVPLTRLDGALRTIGHLFSFEAPGTRADLLPNQLQDVGFLDPPRILECLDHAVTTANMNSVYSSIFPIPLAGTPLQDIGARVHLICEWAVTCYRCNEFGACVAVSILKRVAESLEYRTKLPLQSFFVEFLESFEHTTRVWLLFGELLRYGLFSHDAYVRYLISRGRLESNSTPYRIVLEQLPIFEYDRNGGRRHLALHEHNQRRTILHELSTLDTGIAHHDGLLAAVETITSCMTRSDSSLSPLEPLCVLTLHDRWAVTEWLISSVMHSLTPSFAFQLPQHSCAALSVALTIQTCTDEGLHKAFYVLQAVCDYHGLCELICWVLQHCVDEFLLFAAITTARDMQCAFVAQDKLPELLQALSHVQSVSPTARIHTLTQFVFSDLISAYYAVPAVRKYAPATYPSVPVLSAAVNMQHVHKELELLWTGMHDHLYTQTIEDVVKVIRGLDNDIRVQIVLQSMVPSCEHLPPLQLRSRLTVCASLLGYTYVDLGSVLLIEGIKSALAGMLATANSSVIANLLVMLAVRRVLPAKALISTVLVPLLQENARYISDIRVLSQIELLVFSLRALLGHDCFGEVLGVDERCVLLQNNKIDSLMLMLPTIIRLYSLLNPNGAPPKSPPNASPVDRIADSIRAVFLDRGLVHICATNAPYIYEHLHRLDVLVRRGVLNIISTGIQQTLAIEPHNFATLTTDTAITPKLMVQILEGIVNQHWIVQYGWLQLQLLLDEWVNIDSSGAVVTNFVELLLGHLASNWPSYVVYNKLIELMGDAVQLHTAKTALHILERQYSEDSLAASLVELSYHIKPNEAILPPAEEEGLCNAFASVILASLKDSTIRASYVSCIERQLKRLATGAPHLDSLDTPPHVLHAAQRSVWLRLKLLGSLYPLTRTPDLASTLVQLTSRPFISADESDVGVELMGRLLSCIVSLVEESDDTTRKLSSKMKEVYNTIRLTLPPLYRATMDTTLNISAAPTNTNITPLQGDVASSWSLLEDYPDGPLSPSLLGGCRVDKKVPTYASQVFEREEVPIKRLRTMMQL